MRSIFTSGGGPQGRNELERFVMLRPQLKLFLQIPVGQWDRNQKQNPEQ